MKPTKANKETVDAFLHMRFMAELKALSSHSLENPLTDKEYQHMVNLKMALDNLQVDNEEIRRISDSPKRNCVLDEPTRRKRK